MTSSVIVFELANGIAVFFAYTNHIRRNFQEDHVQHDDHIDLIQPRSQGTLSTSRKYPGYGWSRVC